MSRQRRTQAATCDGAGTPCRQNWQNMLKQCVGQTSTGSAAMERATYNRGAMRAENGGGRGRRRQEQARKAGKLHTEPGDQEQTTTEAANGCDANKRKRVMRSRKLTGLQPGQDDDGDDDDDDDDDGPTPIDTTHEGDNATGRHNHTPSTLPRYDDEGAGGAEDELP